MDYADLDLRGDRGGSEEPTQAYYKYVEERDAATTKVYARMQIGILSMDRRLRT